MAPQVCPRPGPHGPGPDCPLWDARERIHFKRSIEADGAARLGMGALVCADFNRGFMRPASPPTRPVPLAVPSIPVLPDATTEPVNGTKKGVLEHA